jgi:ABC-type glycerol-3-phosphate transport system permease component
MAVVRAQHGATGRTSETSTVSRLLSKLDDDDAASLVAVLPQLIFSLFVQKHIVRGLTMGAVR